MRLDTKTQHFFRLLTEDSERYSVSENYLRIKSYHHVGIFLTDTEMLLRYTDEKSRDILAGLVPAKWPEDVSRQAFVVLNTFQSAQQLYEEAYAGLKVLNAVKAIAGIVMSVPRTKIE